MTSKLSSAMPMNRKVLSILHDPRVPSEGDRPLHEVFGWNSPLELESGFIDDVQNASNGICRYDVVERIVAPEFPVKADGFAYSPEAYMKCWQRQSGFHQPDGVDYHHILEQFNVQFKINARMIDEVWLFGFPYAGYYESIMAGPGAFWCNAPPLEGTGSYERRFVIMGFNFERGVGEMLENLGHRAESILSRVYADRRGDANLWERFTRYDLKDPGLAEVGTVHYAPNSLSDYDWGNRRYVLSKCDDWEKFPSFQGVTRRVNCDEWGGGDTRLHHLWWFRHFPHLQGETDGILNNWWEYVIDPNTVL